MLLQQPQSHGRDKEKGSVMSTRPTHKVTIVRQSPRSGHQFAFHQMKLSFRGFGYTTIDFLDLFSCSTHTQTETINLQTLTTTIFSKSRNSQKALLKGCQTCKVFKGQYVLRRNSLKAKVMFSFHSVEAHLKFNS